MEEEGGEVLAMQLSRPFDGNWVKLSVDCLGKLEFIFCRVKFGRLSHIDENLPEWGLNPCS